MSGRLRPPQPAAHAAVLAVDGVRGANAVTNDDVAAAIDSSDEWIRQRTGIVTRARADAAQDVLDLALGAAQRVVERAGIAPELIDVVILASVTYFCQTPAGAPILASRLGATNAAAYDISAACAGYCYGIAQADSLVRSGNANYVLVVGAEKMSDFIDPTDRSISFLLGDGAGAALIGRAPEPGIGPTVWGADGAQAHAVRQNHSWRDALTSGEWPTLRQEGPTVFKWAVFSMAPVAAKAIAAAGLEPQDIDVFVPHQANLRIVDQMTKLLRLPASTIVARDICDTGNTSAASIPLAIERLQRTEDLEGKLALQIGFGAGLVYAAQVVRLPGQGPSSAA
jgi:3-oxoacyl-[acyl-carrier-protein] synthase-3